MAAKSIKHCTLDTTADQETLFFEYAVLPQKYANIFFLIRFSYQIYSAVIINIVISRFAEQQQCIFLNGLVCVLFYFLIKRVLVIVGGHLRTLGIIKLLCTVWFNSVTWGHAAHAEHKSSGQTMFHPLHMGMRQTLCPLWFPTIFYISGCKDDEMRLLERGWAVMWKQTSIPEWNPFIIHQKLKKPTLAGHISMCFFKCHCSVKSQPIFLPIWEPFWYRQLMYPQWSPLEMFSHIRFLNACAQKANGWVGKARG